MFDDAPEVVMKAEEKENEEREARKAEQKQEVRWKSNGSCTGAGGGGVRVCYNYFASCSCSP